MTKNTTTVAKGNKGAKNDKVSDKTNKATAAANREALNKKYKAEGNGNVTAAAKDVAKGQNTGGVPQALRTPAAKPGQRANTAPKSLPLSNDGKSVHADLPKREPVWSERRVAVVKGMRKLGAVSESTAKTAIEIAKAAGIEQDDVYRVKVILDVYRTNELVHNGFAKSVRYPGERELRYFLTKKGQTTTFPVKE
jgi:hypothetical protein